ncbi:MAG: class I SAM-dependent methyltransferase [Polyangiaceae bacterium]
MSDAAPAPVHVTGNFYDKYATRNPVERALMSGFLRTVSTFTRRVAPRTVLEVGCGEGLLAHHLVTRTRRPDRFVACDIDVGKIRPGIDPQIEIVEASISELPFGDHSFDLVVCCEVLEHLSDPERGFAEVARVAGRAVIASTPREPLWRILNMARGKYLASLGNTPGHVQHFSGRALERLIQKSLRIVARRSPVPWTVLLAEPY